MSKLKILHYQLKDKEEKTKCQELLIHDKNFTENEETDIEEEDNTLQKDPNIFLLNNLLMSVQFFKNYDREIKQLRANWFKELSIESHHKKCFYADFLFKLVGVNVSFSTWHETNRNSKALLHPLRIYISSDNMEAAFDPGALGRYKSNVLPQYRFTVRTNEDYDKSGCITLVEFETLETPKKSSTAKKLRNNVNFNEVVSGKETIGQNSVFWQKKSYSEDKSIRIHTKSEKLITPQNKELNFRNSEKTEFSKYFNATTKSTVPVNGYYKYTSPEAIIKPVNIQDFRMNFSPTISHEVPLPCFQKEEIKKKINARRNGLIACFKTYKLLHSTALKAYFCDLLIEKLFKPLGLDFDSVTQSSVLKEFIIVNYKGTQTHITPVIPIRDWNAFVKINKRNKAIRKTKLVWPSESMQKIIDILPCYAVPSGNPKLTKENLDYEKTWKLVFPKAEEFLILHMMHAHVRCYILVSLIYKSFIEREVNCASFGPEHLMHLLFWKVHKDFLAWPEDRPGETLLNYLKILYKKIQNRTLYDFFITSRNLFAGSPSKDLHKAQVLLKKIIENPVPYIISAIKNLSFESKFYPIFDVLKLKTVLTAANELKTSKKIKKNKKQNDNDLEDDEELQWKKNIIRGVELERKAEKNEPIRKPSVASINVIETLNFNSRDSVQCNQILEMFASHFIKMASKSVEFNFFSQAQFYLDQTQNLFELMVANGMNESSLIETKEKISKLKEICSNKFKKQSFKQSREKLFQVVSKESEKPTVSKEKAKYQEPVTQEIFLSDEANVNEDKIISVKL